MMKLEQFLEEFELYETDNNYDLIAYKGGVTFHNITYRTAREFSEIANEYLTNHKHGHARLTVTSNKIEECNIQDKIAYQEICTYIVNPDTVMPATLYWVEGYADDHFYRTLCKYCMYPKFIKKMNCGLLLTAQEYLSITEALTDEGWENMLDELKVNRNEILNDDLPLVRAYTTLSLVIKHEALRI